MARTRNPFNAQAFLDSAGFSKKIVNFAPSEVIFSQGDPGDSVMYIQRGGVKLSVLSKAGREAVVAMLGPGDFFGEGCLAGQPVRIGSASAIAATSVLVVAKRQMVNVLHKEHALADRFIAHMLSRNVRIEQDLIDQLFNSSEKRLARTLLLLARYGQRDKPRQIVPKISQETLSEMVVQNIPARTYNRRSNVSTIADVSKLRARSASRFAFASVTMSPTRKFL